MRLARDDDLGRAVFVQQQPRQPDPVPEQEVRPLVLGEPPREAQGQHVGVEHLFGIGGFGAVADGAQLLLKPAAHVLHQVLPAMSP